MLDKLRAYLERAYWHMYEAERHMATARRLVRQ